MNIQQILSEGEGLTLNSVTVLDDYGLKQGKTNHRALLVEDSSGKTILKLWGGPSSQAFNKGEVISVQAQGSNGNISASEWNGKWSLNANQCEVTRGGAAPAPQPTAPAAAAPAPAPAPQPVAQAAQEPSMAQTPAPALTQVGGALSPDDLAKHQAAHFAKVLQNIHPACVELGADPSSIVMAAAQMTGSASDWWFGEKYPGCKG